MKKLTLFFAIILLSLASCSGCSDGSHKQDNSNEIVIGRQYPSYPTSASTSSTASLDGNSDEQLRRASIIAGNFVERALGVNCNFESLNYNGEETSVNNRYKVLQKFSCNYEGVESEYVYRIYVQYFGGDWADISNWAMGSLEVESVRTGKTFRFTGDMKKRAESANSVNRKESIDGVAYSVFRTKNNIIFISSDKRLPRTVITKLWEKYKSYWSIRLHKSGKLAIGEEYIDIQDGTVIDFEANKWYDVKTWKEL